MTLAKWTLLIAWARAVVSIGLIRIAGLEEEVRQAQAEIAGLRQKALAARAERDQARAEAVGLLNKLLRTVSEPPRATRTPGPPVWSTLTVLLRAKCKRARRQRSSDGMSFCSG